MKIGIDIDDTVSDTEKAFLIFEEEYDKSINGKGILYPNKKYWNKYDWTNEQRGEFKKRYLFKILQNTYPIVKSQKTITKLKNEGYEIIFITAREEIDNLTYLFTKKWLEEFEFPCDKLIVGAFEKGKICKEEKIDIFIDDSPYQCLAVKNNTNALIIGFKQENDNFKCANNWDEVYEIIHSNN